MQPNENSQTAVAAKAFGRKGKSHVINLEVPNSGDKLVFSPRPMKRNFLNNQYATAGMDPNHPMNSVNSPNMSLQFDLNYSDSSFNIHKLPKQGKPSEYLLKDPPALPDFST